LSFCEYLISRFYPTLEISENLMHMNVFYSSVGGEGNALYPVTCCLVISVVVIVNEQQSPSSTLTQHSMASVPSKQPATLPEEHRILQDVFNQLVQLCTERASHNPVNLLLIINVHIRPSLHVVISGCQ